MPPDVSLCPAKTLTRDLRNGHLVSPSHLSITTYYRHGLLHSYLPNVPCTAVVVCLQDLRSRMGASIAWAARTGLKYSRRNAILPPAARRNTTYSWR